jgi:hypothetical protein
MLKLKYIGCLLLLVTIGSAVGTARAAPNGEMIDRSIGVYVTREGQRYFQNNLEDVLYRNGIALSEGVVAKWKYLAEEPIDLDRLPEKMRKYQETLDGVRTTMKNWLFGFKMNDPRLTATVNNVQYSATFSRLGIRVADQTANKELGLSPDTIVFYLDVEIPQIRVEVASIRANDLNNSFLGTFGINKVWLGLNKQSKPLAFQMPIAISIDPKNGVLVRAMKLKSNLTTVSIGSGFARPLIMPKVELRINDKVMALDHSAVEADLVKRQAGLVQALQAYLKGMSETEVPKRVNALFRLKKAENNGFTEVSFIDPPGKEGFVSPKEKFKLGLVPADIESTPTHLYVGVSSFVSDPLARSLYQLPPSAVNPQRPALSALNPLQYDVALSLNQGVINRMLQLSYFRGYFEKVDMGDGDPFRVVAPPEMRFNGVGGPGHATLHMRIEKPAKGFMENLVLRDKIQIEFDLDIVFKRAPGGLKVVMNQVREQSITIDKAYVERFDGMVKKNTLKRFQATNKGLRASEKTLVDNLPIPPSVIGVPIDLIHMDAEATGNMVLYLKYGAEVRRVK